MRSKMSRPNAYANFHHLHSSLAKTTYDCHQQHHKQQQQPVKLKTASNEGLPEEQEEEQGCTASISQRKLFRLLYAYAILLICLYLAYALYSLHRQQPPNTNQEPPSVSSSAAALESGANQRLEVKLQLLERYIEVLAVDLEDTRRRLSLRERCDCQQGCRFNGTQYADGSSWHRHCETCQCRAGQITCSPQKCPALNCDDAIQLPNTCCPICPRRCQLGKRQLKHNHQFWPQEAPNKLCRCQHPLTLISTLNQKQDGRIKCEPTSQRAGGSLIANSRSASKATAPAPASSSATKSRMSGALNKQQEQHDATDGNKKQPLPSVTTTTPPSG